MKCDNILAILQRCSIGLYDAIGVKIMYGYTLLQWILFLYIYCIIGWCWETLFVSVKKRKFTNRGFMVGPWLPIYGFGAVIMLMASLPVKDNIFLVFVCGMTAATILEYCTGEAMEALFKVRYWDYSNQPFNLNGHICLFCSIGWGIASVVLIKFIHSPIEHFVLGFDYKIQRWAVMILSVFISVDFTLSFRAAMDLKSVLENITQSNSEIRRLKKRLDVLIAVLDDDRQQLMKKYDEKLSQTKVLYRELYENIKEKFSLIDQARLGVEKIKSFPSDEMLNEYEKLKLRFSFINELNDERKRHINIWIRRIVRDNPSFRSDKYDSAVEELKDIVIRKKIKKSKTEEINKAMIKDNYTEIEKRVSEACERSGRQCSDITIIAVSKTKPAEMVEELTKIGVTNFGENKVQEMCRKIESIDKPLNWHLIGHLQRNKVKYIVDKAYMIHSVDSLRLANEIQKEALKAGVSCKVLVEVNIGGEESKNGITAEEAPELVKAISKLSNVKIMGLMTVAPPAKESEDNRKYFAEMKKLFEDIKSMDIPNVEMKELSMGMTGDFEAAIEEGATMVRIGTAIFGERDYSI